MTVYWPGEIVRLNRDVDQFGGTVSAGQIVTIESAWALRGEWLLSVVAPDGRRICSLPADRVDPIAAAPPPTAKPKPKAKPGTVRRTGGTLWD